jgi:hypothetical protein
MGFNRNMPLAVVFGPTSCGGIDLRLAAGPGRTLLYYYNTGDSW